MVIPTQVLVCSMIRADVHGSDQFAGNFTIRRDYPGARIAQAQSVAMGVMDSAREPLCADRGLPDTAEESHPHP